MKYKTYNQYHKLRQGQKQDNSELNKLLGFLEVSLIFDSKRNKIKLNTKEKQLIIWVIDILHVNKKNLKVQKKKEKNSSSTKKSDLVEKYYKQQEIEFKSKPWGKQDSTQIGDSMILLLILLCENSRLPSIKEKISVFIQNLKEKEQKTSHRYIPKLLEDLTSQANSRKIIFEAIPFSEEEKEYLEQNLSSSQKSQASLTPTGSFLNRRVVNKKPRDRILNDSWLSGIIERRGHFLITKIKKKTTVIFTLTLDKRDNLLIIELIEALGEKEFQVSSILPWEDLKNKTNPKGSFLKVDNFNDFILNSWNRTIKKRFTKNNVVFKIKEDFKIRNEPIGVKISKNNNSFLNPEDTLLNQGIKNEPLDKNISFVKNLNKSALSLSLPTSSLEQNFSESGILKILTYIKKYPSFKNRKKSIFRIENKYPEGTRRGELFSSLESSSQNGEILESQLFEKQQIQPLQNQKDNFKNAEGVKNEPLGPLNEELKNEQPNPEGFVSFKYPFGNPQGVKSSFMSPKNLANFEGDSKVFKQKKNQTYLISSLMTLLPSPSLECKELTPTDSFLKVLTLRVNRRVRKKVKSDFTTPLGFRRVDSRNQKEIDLNLKINTELPLIMTEDIIKGKDLLFIEELILHSDEYLVDFQGQKEKDKIKELAQKKIKTKGVKLETINY